MRADTSEKFEQRGDLNWVVPHLGAIRVSRAVGRPWMAMGHLSPSKTTWELLISHSPQPLFHGALSPAWYMPSNRSVRSVSEVEQRRDRRAVPDISGSLAQQIRWAVGTIRMLCGPALPRVGAQCCQVDDQRLHHEIA